MARKRARLTEEQYRLVVNRAKGQCEARLPGVCTRRGQDWHHRQRRNIGSNSPSNGLWLCRACHDYITHREVAVGRARGLVVSAYAPDPAAVPVLIGRHWWLLDDAGGKTMVHLAKGEEK